MTNYSTLSDSPPRHLHVVTDASPQYDERPSEKWSKHVTVEDDDVVDAVAATCGSSALGVYNMLERRVNRDGVWISTYQTLASFFNQSRRHILAAAAVLEHHGFIERTEQFGPHGMSTGVRFYLPKHLRTYRGEATGEVRGEPSRVLNKELSSPVSSREVSATTNVVGAPPKTKPLPEHGDAQKIVAAFCRCAGLAAPAVYGKAIGQAALLVKAGVTPEDLPELFAYANWGDGVDLGKMVAAVDRWRASKTAPPPPRDLKFPPPIQKRIETWVTERTTLGLPIMPYPASLQAVVEDYLAARRSGAM